MIIPEYIFLFFFWLLLGIVSQPITDGNLGVEESKSIVHVGIVLDLNSTVGAVANTCISKALFDFYDMHSDYDTRLFLLTRDSAHVADASLAALDLIKGEEVHAIIGPQKSGQAEVLIELGGKTCVPIISFSATSPSLNPNHSPFFIRTAPDDASQIEPITAIILAYGWKEVVLIHEDTEYGNGLTPYLIDAFESVDINVPYRSVISSFSDDTKILRELEKLRSMQTKVFLVHMTASLGSRLFLLAKDAGMMSKGYAWIINYGFSTLLDPVSTETIDSMQGVLGIRPYIPMSKNLIDFIEFWKKYSISNKWKNGITELNLFGLWAYDTVWALANVIEKIGMVKWNSSKSHRHCIGSELINEISNISFKGLSGEFHLVKGQLEVSSWEIFNVIGNRKRTIGYWTPEQGLSGAFNMSSKVELKQPIWPGDTTEKPTGWFVSPVELRIGVPVKQGFTEFSKVVWDPLTGNPTVSGFGHDIFMEVLNILPFFLPHKFIPYVKNHSQESAGTYDELLYQIKEKKYDAVVGDTTILASRSTYVDFTLPYSESGVSMIVAVKDDNRDTIWIFLKPLSLELWLTTCAAFIVTGLVVWVLEHRINTDFRGPPKQQLGMIFWFSFSTLVFAQREKVVNNLSRIVLIVWIFVVLIITQSYTASLASLLTVRRLQPTYIDITELRKDGHFIGHKKNSFVKDFLIQKLRFNETKLVSLQSVEEYHEALSKGSKKGGVSAIFDGLPYIGVFLNRYGSKYEMVGPIYKVNGFGFAFPLGSNLVPYISRAILNVTEDKAKMDVIEKKYSLHSASSKDQYPTVSTGNMSLGVTSFGGLFIITGVTSTLSLLIFIVKFIYSNRSSSLNHPLPERDFKSRIVALAKHFDKKDFSWYSFKTEESRVHPITNPVTHTGEDLEAADDMQPHPHSSHISDRGDSDVVDEANEIPSSGRPT